MRERCFQLLGLREDATKSQIEEAYQRRIKNYKSADYDDEPEYAHMKISELKEAYSQAMGISPSMASSDFRRRPKEENPDLDIKEKLFKSEDNLKSRLRKIEPKVKAEKRKAEYESDQEKPRPIKINPVTEPADTIGNTYESYSNSTFSGGDVKKGKNKALGMIFAILLTVIPLSVSLLENDNSSNDWDFSDTSFYSYDYNNDKDVQIHEIAIEIFDYTYNFDYESTDIDESSINIEDLDIAGKGFAKKYFGLESIEDVTDYINDNYDDFGAASSDDLDSQIYEILSFYGFPSLDDLAGYLNPEDGKAISNYVELLNYYSFYFDVR